MATKKQVDSIDSGVAIIPVHGEGLVVRDLAGQQGLTAVDPT
ncbi:MAG TPA: hypothetical protein VGS41_00560 [Chthonomonadales bacterium]|nr:hypothetical protein [Chthonomonadales bacterium]